VLDSVDIDDDNDGILDTVENDLSLFGTSFKLYNTEVNWPTPRCTLSVSGSAGTTVNYTPYG
jgi:hypothetical protein